MRMNDVFVGCDGDVRANRELIAHFEKKIQATLAHVWGEEEPGATEASSIEEVAELSN